MLNGDFSGHSETSRRFVGSSSNQCRVSPEPAHVLMSRVEAGHWSPLVLATVPLTLSISAAAGLKISTTLSRASRGNEGGGRKRARGAVSPPANAFVSDLHLRFKQTRPLAI